MHTWNSYILPLTETKGIPLRISVIETFSHVFFKDKLDDVKITGSYKLVMAQWRERCLGKAGETAGGEQCFLVGLSAFSGFQLSVQLPCYCWETAEWDNAVTVLVKYRETRSLTSSQASATQDNDKVHGACLLSPSCHRPSSSPVDRGMPHIFRPQVQQSTFSRRAIFAERRWRKFVNPGEPSTRPVRRTSCFSEGDSLQSVHFW